MIPIEKIQTGQRWAFVKILRGDIEISHVNASSQVIYWYYVDYNSHIFDSPYSKFIVDFTPRDLRLFDTDTKNGPNDDRNFLI